MTEQSISIQSPAYWLQHSQPVFTATEVDQAVQRMAHDIQQQLAAEAAGEAVVMMCVMRGGLYLMGQLMAHVRLPLEIDYLQANRYHGLSGEQIHWAKQPELDLAGRLVLVVDDILDEGVTLAEVVAFCQQAGAKKVYSAVLTEKENGLKKPIQADFIGLSVPNRYVFGCGMDVHGWWRNLPEIRALTPA